MPFLSRTRCLDQPRDRFLTGYGHFAGAAIDNTVRTRTREVFTGSDGGQVSYHQAMRRVTVLEAGGGVIEVLSDVYRSLSPGTRSGSGDPGFPTPPGWWQMPRA